MAVAQLDGAVARWKSRLLDLSRRNRLLYFRATQASTLTLIEPEPEAIFHRFANRLQARFVIADSHVLQPPLPIDETPVALAASSGGTAATPPRRLKSNEVRGDVGPPKLARVLFNLRQRANTAIEEQGVNILFVAAGFLNWIDQSQQPPEVSSPLLLIPVRLLRPHVGEPYVLQEIDDAVEVNPVLAYKLANDFGIQLPAPPDDGSPMELRDYLDEVRAAIRKQPNWSVEPRLVLSTFAFHKLAMVRDLDQNRDLVVSHPIARALAGDLTAVPSPPSDLPQPEMLDELPAAQSALVLDADASQQHAVAVSLRGANCVIHGPPGTGKSQTIANLIAEFLAAGKTVLFVAEKRAALEVVYRRLEQVGLGEFCLDAYDIDKERVYQHLTRTRRLCGQKVPAPDDTSLALDERRKRLNELVRALHTPIGPLGITPYAVHGHLAALADAPILPCRLPSPSRCTREQKKSLDALVQDLAAHAETIAQYDTHPWRHSREEIGGLGWQAEAEHALEAAIDDVESLAAPIASVATALGIPPPSSVAHARLLLRFAELYPSLRAMRDDLEARYQPLDDLDLASLLERFRTNYASFFGRLPLVSGYGKDLGLLRARLRGADRLDHQTALHDLEKALAVKLSRELLTAVDAGRAPDWEALAPAVDTLTALVKRMPATGQRHEPSARALGAIVPQLRTSLEASERALSYLSELFHLDRIRIAGQPPEFAPLADLGEWIRVRKERLGDHAPWQSLQRVCERCDAAGLTAFMETVLQTARKSTPLSPDQIRRGFERRFYQQWADETYPSVPALRDFSGIGHDEAVAHFRNLDSRHISLTAPRLRAELIARLPEVVLDAAPSGSELARLDHELRKQRRRMPVRKLFATVPNVLLRLTPCVMMSPLAVAQTVDPNKLRFDVVIFDEASQLCTEDAIGAIVRSQQIIVAGDDKQLPPTAFFKSNVADDEPVDDEGEPALETYESLLEQCLALNLPQPRLRFHYRSRDETLIAFSNQHFYDGDLVTFPAAELGTRGVRLHRVTGTYDRGGSRTNRDEAAAVADLVFQHFRERPEKSLGVIALSQAQQQAILDELEHRRYENQEYERFFAEDLDEPFFVKNLENVQGDERDVIFLSVGYGKDANGKLTLSFGPLNAKGGRRRLNVAVTRAREQMVVVSSIGAADLPADSPNEGVALLRRYLDFADRGVAALSSTPAPTGGLAESPFEESVGRELMNRGYIVHRQVGCSGYRIDLAIVDPRHPGRYLLGIECDGAMYHSSPTARERDRIRQQVLERLGWRLIRIWSYEWVRNREAQIERIKAALEQSRSPDQHATSESPAASGNGKPVEPAVTASGIEADRTSGVVKVEKPAEMPKVLGANGAHRKDDHPGPEASSDTTMVYRAADLGEPRTSFDEATAAELANAVRRIVEQESPVHLETIIDRLREHWQLDRVGSRMRERIEQAVQQVASKRGIRRRGSFLWSAETPTDPVALPVRVPALGDEPRDVDRIPPEEIAAAARLQLQAGVSLSASDLIRSTAQLLGYARTGKGIHAAIEQALPLLVKAGVAKRDNDQYTFVK